MTVLNSSEFLISREFGKNSQLVKMLSIIINKFSHLISEELIRSLIKILLKDIYEYIQLYISIIGKFSLKTF
jgi:hypothetical protein